MRAILSIFICITFYLASNAQIDEIGAVTQGKEAVIGYNYKFTSELDDTVSIKIIDPRGQLIALPVQKKTILSSASIPFGFKTSFWLPGQYQILVETEKGNRYVKRLNVDNTGKKIIRQ